MKVLNVFTVIIIISTNINMRKIEYNCNMPCGDVGRRGWPGGTAVATFVPDGTSGDLYISGGGTYRSKL